MRIGAKSALAKEKTYRVPPVTAAGAALTKEENDRVEMSFETLGISRRSSNMPCGGFGAS
jgi:hypothetical protein